MQKAAPFYHYWLSLRAIDSNWNRPNSFFKHILTWLFHYISIFTTQCRAKQVKQVDAPMCWQLPQDRVRTKKKALKLVVSPGYQLTAHYSPYCIDDSALDRNGQVLHVTSSTYSHLRRLCAQPDHISRLPVP